MVGIGPALLFLFVSLRYYTTCNIRLKQNPVSNLPATSNPRRFTYTCLLFLSHLLLPAISNLASHTDILWALSHTPPPRWAISNSVFSSPPLSRKGVPFYCIAQYCTLCIQLTVSNWLIGISCVMTGVTSTL